MKIIYKNAYVRLLNESNIFTPTYLVLNNIKYPLSIGKEIKIAKKRYFVMCMGNLENNLLVGKREINEVNRNSLQSNFDCRIREMSQSISKNRNSSIHIHSNKK